MPHRDGRKSPFFGVCTMLGSFIGIYAHSDGMHYVISFNCRSGFWDGCHRCATREDAIKSRRMTFDHHAKLNRKYAARSAKWLATRAANKRKVGASSGTSATAPKAKCSTSGTARNACTIRKKGRCARS